MRPRAIPGALALVVFLSVTAAATAARPLETAIFPDPRGTGSDAVVFERIAAAGAGKVRLVLDWRKVAPSGTRAPAGFNAANPADPAYTWASVDREVRLAAAQGLEPILTVVDAPDWAEGSGSGPQGTVRPSASKYAQFVRAAALRYSGSFEGLPRIRFWLIWNEPNIDTYLSPQFANGQPFSADRYRALLNAGAGALKAVSRDNVVIAGALSPFTVKGSTGPMRFMRRLLCLSSGSRPHAVCSARARFDVWAHHPYTSGGPTHHAFNPDDVSLGDLPEMRVLLRAGERAGKIVSDRPVGFWVTEFSWDSRPPDAGGLPLALHARWTAEALYRMWQSGVTLATWFLLVDQAHDEGFAQSGLYLRAAGGGPGRAKPTLQAFRFPFVAYARGQGLLVWGRTPTSRPAAVAVEQKSGGSWRRVKLLQANRYGIFQAALSGRRGNGFVRARLVPTGGASLAFSLHEPPDRHVCPFGANSC
jgi:hypothetical protein